MFEVLLLLLLFLPSFEGIKVCCWVKVLTFKWMPSGRGEKKQNVFLILLLVSFWCEFFFSFSLLILCRCSCWKKNSNIVKEDEGRRDDDVRGIWLCVYCVTEDEDIIIFICWVRVCFLVWEGVRFASSSLLRVSETVMSLSLCLWSLRVTGIALASFVLAFLF